MSGSISKTIIPPGYLTFLKMPLIKFPVIWVDFKVKCPTQWLGMKSQKFHNLSGIDERIVKDILGSQSIGQKLRMKASHGSKFVIRGSILVLAILYSFEGFDKTRSAWLFFFCAERFISAMCLLAIIFRRGNCASKDYFKRSANEVFHSF